MDYSCELLCVLSVFINPVRAFKVKQCTPSAEKSIKQAYKFVARNLDGMVACHDMAKSKRQAL